ncbi:MAG: transporter [Cyclobacteriaceae bacterium]|jgi:hypothetical protein|nr:transporter [Cyclobacteriaceae bacterium]
MQIKVLCPICIILLLVVLWQPACSQNRSVDVTDGSDPATMISKITTDFESYAFVGDARYYAIRLGYDYGLANGKHLVGMSIPFVHTIFIGDYGGYENTTGIGDLKMRYMYVPIQKKSIGGLQRLSTYFEVTAPTGEYESGKGAGAWMYKPGVIFTYQSGPSVSFYPELKFQFSGGDANSVGGGDGAPDQGDPEKDGPTQNLSLSIPAVVTVRNWDGWFSLNAQYTQSFSENTYYLFLRTDFGKMIGNKTAASLNISKFIAGQPLLNVLVQARFQFFMR